MRLYWYGEKNGWHGDKEWEWADGKQCLEFEAYPSWLAPTRLWRIKLTEESEDGQCLYDRLGSDAYVFEIDRDHYKHDLIDIEYGTIGLSSSLKLATSKVMAEFIYRLDAKDELQEQADVAYNLYDDAKEKCDALRNKINNPE